MFNILRISPAPDKTARLNSEFSKGKVLRNRSHTFFIRNTEELMQSKINWIDNLRGIACLMVVMIHTTTRYVTNAHSISPVNWDVANILNSASRVSVPLFFMISGFLFLASVARSRDISSVLSPVCCFTAPFRCSISSCSLQLMLNVPCSICCKNRCSIICGFSSR